MQFLPLPLPLQRVWINLLLCPLLWTANTLRCHQISSQHPSTSSVWLHPDICNSCAPQQVSPILHLWRPGGWKECSSQQFCTEQQLLEWNLLCSTHEYCTAATPHVQPQDPPQEIHTAPTTTTAITLSHSYSPAVTPSSQSLAFASSPPLYSGSEFSQSPLSTADCRKRKFHFQYSPAGVFWWGELWLCCWWPARSNRRWGRDILTVFIASWLWHCIFYIVFVM